MLGLFSLISEAKVPGSVPALAGLIKPYDGEVPRRGRGFHKRSGTTHKWRLTMS